MIFPLKQRSKSVSISAKNRSLFCLDISSLAILVLGYGTMASIHRDNSLDFLFSNSRIAIIAITATAAMPNPKTNGASLVSVPDAKRGDSKNGNTVFFIQSSCLSSILCNRIAKSGIGPSSPNSSIPISLFHIDMVVARYVYGCILFVFIRKVICFV